MRRRVTLTALGAVLCVGCGERSPEYGESIQLLPPEAIEDHVVFVDQGRSEARILDVSGSAANAPLTVALPQGARRAEPRKGAADELLLLCAGTSAGERHDETPAELVVLDAAGVQRRYELAARFNGMIQSEDGKLAFLFFDPTAKESVDSLLFNPNEVQIVDLDAEPGDRNPEQRTLRSLGSLPRSVTFSPELSIGGRARRLALVLFDSDVAILDLSTSMPEITVPLAGSSAAGLTLTQVIWNAAEQKAYLRGTGGNDIFVLTLSEGGSAGGNDFVASVNQLGAGVGPADMAVYRDPSPTAAQTGSRLLVASAGSSEVFVIDADSSRATPLSLERPANKIHLFEGATPTDDSEETRALLYMEGTDALSFVDLRDLEERRTRNVELMTLDDKYSRVLPLEGQLLLLIHESTGLSVLDLEARTVQPIRSQSRLSLAVEAFDKLWLAPSGETRVGFLDLVHFHPSEVRLDDPVELTVAVPSRSAPRFVVTHRSSVGHITVLDAGTPSDRDRAFSARGFLLDNVLEAP